MNKAKLKSYAPQARKDFIAAVTARANLLGLSESVGELDVATSQPQGDVTLIVGQAWPIKVHSQRQQLITRIQKDGFAQTMEAVAYTWFNRFAALRYMELHDYLGHGYRALSSLDGTLPDILTHATDLAQNGVNSGGLPGLKPALVTEMKLAGNRDGELYSLLLVAQCNALSNVMPFLFERIDDETELLLPDNLLRTDSVIAKLVENIDEEDWKEVEIIGWLYQFYISDKKDEVIGSVIKSEDIPAATQLFTPNWVVQYLVQNSVGRLWLSANPASTLKAQWPYYITPADQTTEVQTQLDNLIQTRVNEDGDNLNPESITLLDPACGSGHILVEAYEVLKAIYLERGYQPRAIPRLILEKNLYGLDIDDRAAQMAGFALLMKARADDRRLFNEPVKLNVLSLQESKGLDADVLTRALQTFASSVSPQIADGPAGSGKGQEDLFPEPSSVFCIEESSAAYRVDDWVEAMITSLIAVFTHAKTFGSLIQIPKVLNSKMAALSSCLQSAFQNGDLYAKAAAGDLLPLMAQARILGMQFDAVVANPPYMGGQYFCPVLSKFIQSNFPAGKSDLYGAFILRNIEYLKASGSFGMITMQNWMFLSGFSSLRKNLFESNAIESFIHNGRGMWGSDFGSCSFIVKRESIQNYQGSYFKLFDRERSVATVEELEARFRVSKPFLVFMSDFQFIPGSPLSYWTNDAVRGIFKKYPSLESVSPPKSGMTTGDDGRFLRLWYEVALPATGFDLESSDSAIKSGLKWFPYNKGGSFRKWFGNNLTVVNWKNDGAEIKKWIVSNPNDPKTKSWSRRIFNYENFFQECLTYTLLSGSNFCVRYINNGAIFNVNGPSIFNLDNKFFYIAGLMNSKVGFYLLKTINPTLAFNPGDVAKLPIALIDNSIAMKIVEKNVEKTICAYRDDWDSAEVSWGFSTFQLMSMEIRKSTLGETWYEYDRQLVGKIHQACELEGEINSIFINAYGLESELSPEVLGDEITLARADREKDCQRLISYAIGSMMGRYSLDEPGLIYANFGNFDFDAGRYTLFPADADGILPLTDELWFEDEAASRIREFLLAVWGAETLNENMTWLAESLGSKAGETADETIRRYLAARFYKDHLQTYKKRPIYWLFTSGKQGAFQALVYLHRYHEGTLSRMRAEYVVPLTGKIQSRIDMLEKDAAAASSTAARNKLTKEVERLKKKHVELLAYDEKLRHYADMRITLDLDDGVKLNYGKFGDLLADVKAVTGGASDD